MSITVTISVNGRVIYTRSARNLDGKPISCYQVDDGSTIVHRREDGAIPLAKAMLDTIHDVDIPLPPRKPSLYRKKK